MHQEPPLITVVIPVYNRETIVMRCLDSLIAQTLKDFKVILVDNNSTDATPDVLKKWASKAPMEVKVLSCPTPGAAAARQCGLDAVDTPWTLFFDSDDVMLPGHMAAVIAGIDDNPKADIIGWNVYLNNSRHWQRFYTKDLSYRILFNGSMATQRYCARTWLFMKAGGWNPQIKLWDDIELGARMLRCNPTIVKLDGKPQVKVIPSPDSISNLEDIDNIDIINRTLRSIKNSLGLKDEKWCDAKRAVIAAISHDGKDFFKQLKSKSKNKLLLSFVYYYVKSGLPGFSHIIKPFM